MPEILQRPFSQSECVKNIPTEFWQLLKCPLLSQKLTTFIGSTFPLLLFYYSAFALQQCWGGYLHVRHSWQDGQLGQHLPSPKRSGDPLPGERIHQKPCHWSAHYVNIFLSLFLRTSKTEVLQTPSAIEVNLGQGVKRWPF